MLSVPEVTLILGSFQKRLWYVWLSPGRIYLGMPLSIALAIYLPSPTLQYSLRRCIILQKKTPRTKPEMCITGYVHGVINMHMICMQIVLLKIVTISITSAYYLLRCNSGRRPAGVWHPSFKLHHLSFLRLHILLSSWMINSTENRATPFCAFV